MRAKAVLQITPQMRILVAIEAVDGRKGIDMLPNHVTIWRRVQRYAPELNRQCRPKLRRTNRSWRVDET
jgi:transposase-like protein